MHSRDIFLRAFYVELFELGVGMKLFHLG